jgi:hypothetical protein
MEIEIAKKAKKKVVRREYTKGDMNELRAHSKARTPIAKDTEVDQKDGRFIASEGTQARHQPRASQIAAEHPTALICERLWVFTPLTAS